MTHAQTIANPSQGRPERVLLDKTGREICVGDTLKVFHFVGARRKRHYMYKYVRGVVQTRDKAYFEVSHLSPTADSYRLVIDGSRHEDIEVVQGYGGVAPGQSFSDRPIQPPVSS